MPRLFKQINIELTYKNQHHIPFQLAYENSPQTWNWKFLYPQAEIRLADNWQKKTFSFLTNNAKIINNQLRFMLSAPMLRKTDYGIDLREIKIIFKD